MVLISMKHVLGGFFIWYTKFQCPLLSLIQQFSWWVTLCNMFCQQQEVQTVNRTFPFSPQNWFLSDFANLSLHISLLELKGQDHSLKLWNSSLCAPLIASTTAIKSFKAEKNSVFCTSLFYIFGHVRENRYDLEIHIANSCCKFQSQFQTWQSSQIFSFVVCMRETGSGKSLRLLLFVSIPAVHKFCSNGKYKFT